MYGCIGYLFSLGKMNQSYGNASASSSSSMNSSCQDTEDDHTIASILAQDENLRTDGKLGKRLSHLDSIPVCSSFCPWIFCSLRLRNALSKLEESYKGEFRKLIACDCLDAQHACMSWWLFACQCGIYAWRNLYDSLVYFWGGLALMWIKCWNLNHEVFLTWLYVSSFQIHHFINLSGQILLTLDLILSWLPEMRHILASSWNNLFLMSFWRLSKFWVLRAI